MGLSSMFKEQDGLVSMRRVLALIFTVEAIVNAVMCFLYSVQWQVALVVIGLPVIAVLLLMFFTTWADISGIVSAIKK